MVSTEIHGGRRETRLHRLRVQDKLAAGLNVPIEFALNFFAANRENSSHLVD